MNLPSTMGCIVRTAGLSRTKTEIKRDFDYLARLWDEIREKTLSASAPQKIHSDSDLIKRAIRDIYNREIEEVFVEGNEGYRAAKDFMKLLMPSHARRVKQYANPTPLFQFYGAEEQLNAMYDPVVQLKSGGYLVINPTEALVSIDINSGRSTREHGIEATAVSTNLEAAREIARQLRLRDMAGLVVIDFIDMERGGNIRKVEKEMRDALKSDRARIQVGRISGFGLMEMSRQRLRTGVLEASTRVCPHCDGTGLVRTASSSGLAALRLLEEEAAKGKGNMLTLRTSQEATIYVLNNKRAGLNEIEDRYGVSIQILPNGDHEGAKMTVDVSGGKPQFREDTQGQLSAPELDEEPEENEPNEAQHGDDERGDKPKRRRRRRGRRGRKNGDEAASDNAGDDNQNAASDAGEDNAQNDASANDAPANDATADKPKRPRRRRRKPDDNAADGAVKSDEPSSDQQPVDATVAKEEEPAADAKPKRTRRKRTPKAEAQSDTANEAANEASTDGAPVDSKPADGASDGNEVAEAKPKRTRRKAAPKASATADDAIAKDAAAKKGQEKAEPAEKAKPKRAPRKTTRKKAEPEAKAEPATAAAPAPSKSDDAPKTADSEQKPAGEQKNSGRKGWWQRTFGN
jgi:ribonuclease E